MPDPLRSAPSPDRAATTPRRRLLILARELTLGGAAWMAIRLARRLSAGFDVELLILGPAEPVMLDAVPANVALHRAGAGLPECIAWRAERTVLGPVLLAAAGLPAGLRGRRFDVLLSTSILFSARACVAHALIDAPLKLLFLPDTALAEYPRLPLGRALAIDLAIRASDRVVSVSESLHAAMARACPPLRERPLTVLPPPLDEHLLVAAAPAHLADAAGRSVQLLTIARLVQGKHVLDCLRIHHVLRLQGLDIVWHVVGDGEERGRIATEIERLGMGDAFLLHGAQQDVIAWLQRADALVLFSDSEGCPTVVLEALHLGCPVITTAVYGVAEYVRDGDNGLIVPIDPLAVQQAVSRFAGDPALRRRLRAGVAARPVRGAIETQYTRFLKLLDTPMSTAPAGPLVSILIPTYAQAAVLDRAISSALAQSHPALEVVVIDDASPDDTARVCAAWAHDPRLRTVRNPRNLGRVANYRRALYELARGEWVLMLDGDDCLTDPDFVATACRLIAEQPAGEVVFVQAGHVSHFPDGSQPDRPTLPDFPEPWRILDGGEYLKLVFGTGFFTHLGLLYNRRAAIEADCYRADISSSDMESFLRLAQNGRVIVLNRTVGRWVQSTHGASASVPSRRVAENVLIFRAATEAAIARGRVARGDIEPALAAYQARTLAHLYHRAIEREPDGPASPMHLAQTILAIHPRLFLQPRILRLFAFAVLHRLRRGGPR